MNPLFNPINYTEEELSIMHNWLEGYYGHSFRTEASDLLTRINVRYLGGIERYIEDTGIIFNIQ